MTEAQIAHTMALVDEYAAEHAAAQCEKLYGGSKSYATQCIKDAAEARAAVEAALRDAPTQASQPLTYHQKLCMWRDCTIDLASPKNCYMRGIEDAERYHGINPPGAPTAVEPVQQDAVDAERYRLLRRGQNWSVIDGIGNVLRGDDLDAAIAAQKGKP